MVEKAKKDGIYGTVNVVDTSGEVMLTSGYFFGETVSTPIRLRMTQVPEHLVLGVDNSDWGYGVVEMYNALAISYDQRGRAGSFIFGACRLLDGEGPGYCDL